MHVLFFLQLFIRVGYDYDFSRKLWVKRRSRIAAGQEAAGGQNVCVVLSLVSRQWTPAIRTGSTIA